MIGDAIPVRGNGDVTNDENKDNILQLGED